MSQISESDARELLKQMDLALRPGVRGETDEFIRASFGIGVRASFVPGNSFEGPFKVKVQDDSLVEGT